MAALIPFSLMGKIIIVFHHKHAHIGRDKIFNLLTKHVCHPRVYKVASDICNACPQ